MPEGSELYCTKLGYTIIYYNMKKENWIKADEQLPGDDADVLVYDYRQGVLIASYEPNWGWISCEHGTLDYVTHWMPLELPEVSWIW